MKKKDYNMTYEKEEMLNIPKENTLKTLKDLGLNDVDEYSDAEYLIRAEAIKWVKKLKSEDNMAQAFIMSEFFYITEEELK